MEVKYKRIFIVTFTFFTMTYLTFIGDWYGKIFYILINQDLHTSHALGRMGNKSMESNKTPLGNNRESKHVTKQFEYTKGKLNSPSKGTHCNARQIISDLYSSYNNSSGAIQNIIARLSQCGKIYYPSNPKCASRTVKSVAKTTSLQNHFNLWDYAKHLYFDFDNDSQERTLMEQLYQSPGMTLCFDHNYFHHFLPNDLEPFVKAMYRKLEPFVWMFTYQVLSSSQIASLDYGSRHFCGHFFVVMVPDPFSCFSIY